MKLLAVPVELWQNLLYSWLSLPDLIRFDRATSNVNVEGSELRKEYSGNHFSFSDVGNFPPVYLEKLLSWMKTRKVYFKHMTIGSNADAPQWSQILEWTGSTVRSLSLFTPAFDGVSLFCSVVEQMMLQSISMSTLQMYIILSNNISTLKSLHLNNFYLSDASIDFPELQITDLFLTNCDEESMVKFLSKSPQLKSLSLQDFSIESELAQCIATSCSNLQNLHMNNMGHVERGLLLSIAQNCPDIKFLSLVDCGEAYFEDFDKIVSALPNLLKLEVAFRLNYVEVDALETVASQSLRAVEIRGLGFAVSKLELFLQHCPNIAALLLTTTCLNGGDLCSILKFCPNLRYLQFGGLSLFELRSVATCCPLLRTLNANSLYRTAFMPEGIDELLSCCPQINKLVLGKMISDYIITDPLICARVAVTREGPLRLADWDSSM